MKRVLVILISMFILCNMDLFSADFQVCDGLGEYRFGMSKKNIIKLIKKNDRPISKTNKNEVWAGGEFGDYICDILFSFKKDTLCLIAFIVEDREPPFDHNNIDRVKELGKYTSMYGEPVKQKNDFSETFNWVTETTKGGKCFLEIMYLETAICYTYSTINRIKNNLHN